MRPQDIRQPPWLQEELDALESAEPGQHDIIMAIDASNFVYREAFAIRQGLIAGQAETNTEHLYTTVIKGLTEHATIASAKHVALCFDHPAGSYRNVLKGQGTYKRPKDVIDAHVRDTAKFVLDALREDGYNGMAKMEAEGYEADDLLYCLAAVESRRAHVVIYTSDEDICQALLYDRVTIYNPAKKGFVTRQSWEKDNYMTLDKLPLRKAVVGDPSDNIAGLPGVGIRTFHKWLVEPVAKIDEGYRTIIDNLDLITLPGMGAAKAYLLTRPEFWVEFVGDRKQADDVFDDILPF